MTSDFLGFVERARRAHEQALAEAGITEEQHEANVLAEEKRAREEQRARMEQEARSDLLDRMRGRITDDVAKRIATGTLADTASLQAVRAWLAAPKPMLVLTGGVGTGKTVAALWGLTQVRGDLVYARDLARRHEVWGSDRDYGVRPIDLRHRLIVLDDLGTEATEDRRFAPALDELIDSRQGGGLRTIITTNLEAPEIRRDIVGIRKYLQVAP